MISSILLFTFLSCASHALDHTCPLHKSIEPKCVCRDFGDGPMMVCDNLMNPTELRTVVRKAENHDMFSLTVQNSSFPYIPDGIFRNTHFKKILLAGTDIISLAETDVAFEGLEDTLEEFRIMNLDFAAKWSWNQLRNFHKLEIIEVDRVPLGSINEQFPPLQSLKGLAITRAGISFITSYAFSNLRNLTLLVLANNDISELNRNMFPDPAEKLATLDLSNNKLITLPPNIFHRMPELSELQLANNRIATLEEAVFYPAVTTVYTLSLAGNKLRCDCRMRWIVGVRKSFEFHAVCSEPENLKERSIEYLEVKDLWC